MYLQTLLPRRTWFTRVFLKMMEKTFEKKIEIIKKSLTAIKLFYLYPQCRAGNKPASTPNPFREFCSIGTDFFCAPRARPAMPKSMSLRVPRTIRKLAGFRSVWITCAVGEGGGGGGANLGLIYLKITVRGHRGGCFPCIPMNFANNEPQKDVALDLHLNRTESQGVRILWAETPQKGSSL